MILDHFCLFDVQSGHVMLCLAVQTLEAPIVTLTLTLKIAMFGAAYYAATLLLEVGWLQIAYHYITVWLKKRLVGLRRRHHSQGGYEQTSSDSAAEAAEDEDVQEERLALQSGQASLGLLCVYV